MIRFLLMWQGLKKTDGKTLVCMAPTAHVYITSRVLAFWEYQVDPRLGLKFRGQIYLYYKDP